MIFKLVILENTKAQLIVDEIQIRDEEAVELLKIHYEGKGHIVKIFIEE